MPEQKCMEGIDILYWPQVIGKVKERENLPERDSSEH